MKLCLHAKFEMLWLLSFLYFLYNALCMGRECFYQVEKVLRGQRRYSVLETRNDGVRFTNSHLRSLSQQFQSLRESYESTQATIAEEVLAIAAGYAEPLATLSSLLAKMDVLVRSACMCMYVHVCGCVVQTLRERLFFVLWCPQLRSYICQCTNSLCETNHRCNGYVCY